MFSAGGDDWLVRSIVRIDMLINSRKQPLESVDVLSRLVSDHWTRNERGTGWPTPSGLPAQRISSASGEWIRGVEGAAHGSQN